MVALAIGALLSGSIWGRLLFLEIRKWFLTLPCCWRSRLFDAWFKLYIGICGHVLPKFHDNQQSHEFLHPPNLQGI